MEGESNATGSGSVNRSERVSLTIAAVVTDVLANGNLVIQGRQEVRTNREVRELTVAGIVRPEIDTARDELRTYPPELPDQRYIRTGKRYRATRVEYLGGQSYRLISDPSYKGRSADPYVLGDAYGQGQARIHQGRWRLLKDAVEASIERILARVREEFNKIIAGGGAPGL